MPTIARNIQFPVPANLPALNLRLVHATENPRERLEISEASVQALGEVPKYEEVARFTQEALQGVTGTARRQAMLSAALAAMASCPTMGCVGHALIGHAPAKNQLSIASRVLTEVESTSAAPELSVARRLLEDPVLTGAEKAQIVQSAIDRSALAPSLIEATADLLSVRFERAGHRKHAAQVAIDAILPLVPPYSREVLELASDLLVVQKQPSDALRVTADLFYAAGQEPGRELTSTLHEASLKVRGASRQALLEQGFDFLREWSTVPGMVEAVDLVQSVAVVGEESSRRVRSAALHALATGAHDEQPVLAAAQGIVDLAGYTAPHGGIGETPACEPVLVALLESLRTQVSNPQVMTEAIAKVRDVEPSTEIPLGRSTRQAHIARRAVQSAKLL